MRTISGGGSTIRYWLISSVVPAGAGRPSRDAIRAVTERVAPPPGESSDRVLSERTIDAAVAEAARKIGRFRAITRSRTSKVLYSGPGRVRDFLLNVFGRGGEDPVAGQLGNHIRWQPVVHVSPDGQTARIRSRMDQQMSRGQRASMGAAIYENETVREGGRWKLSAVHAYTTWGGSCEDGWIRNASICVPGPSADFPPDAPPTFEFRMFPTVYDIPFHYANPAQ